MRQSNVVLGKEVDMISTVDLYAKNNGIIYMHENDYTVIDYTLMSYLLSLFIYITKEFFAPFAIPRDRSYNTHVHQHLSTAQWMLMIAIFSTHEHNQTFDCTKVLLI
jgi:hypothetical protein